MTVLHRVARIPPATSGLASDDPRDKLAAALNNHLEGGGRIHLAVPGRAAIPLSLHARHVMVGATGAELGRKSAYLSDQRGRHECAKRGPGSGNRGGEASISGADRKICRGNSARHLLDACGVNGPGLRPRKQSHQHRAWCDHQHFPDPQPFRRTGPRTYAVELQCR
jgi:hypothetical protein